MMMIMMMVLVIFGTFHLTMNDNNVLIALVDVNDVDDAFDEWRAPGSKRGTKRIFWRRKVSLH